MPDMLVHHDRGKRPGFRRETRAWQEKVPHSELVVLPGDSFHVAATDPERCAEALLDFLARHANTKRFAADKRR